MSRRRPVKLSQWWSGQSEQVARESQSSWVALKKGVSVLQLGVYL